MIKGVSCRLLVVFVSAGLVLGLRLGDDGAKLHEYEDNGVYPNEENDFSGRRAICNKKSHRRQTLKLIKVGDGCILSLTSFC